MHGLKLGKVNLGNEAERPGTTPDVAFGLSRALPPLQSLFPSLCAQEPVKPVAATEQNAAGHGTCKDAFPFLSEWRPDGPVGVRRYVGLAAEAART